MICHRLRDAASGLKGRLIPACTFDCESCDLSPIVRFNWRGATFQGYLVYLSGQVYEQRNLDGFTLATLPQDALSALWTLNEGRESIRLESVHLLQDDVP